MEIMISIRENQLKNTEETIRSFEYYLKKLNKMNSNITVLYAQSSESIEEAMEYKLVDLTGKRYEENLHLIDGDLAEGAWSGDLYNEASILIDFMGNQSIITLSIETELKSNELFTKVKELFLELNSDFELIFFNVNYPSANVVYPDRPSTSWMLFIKDTNFSEAKIDQAEVIEDIEKDGVKIGELLITTKNYDPKNTHHQNRSNDIDILLLGYHLLPKYKEIYAK